MIEKIKMLRKTLNILHTFELKTDKTYKDLLDAIWQIIYSLYQSTEITKEVCKTASLIQYKTYAILINWKNDKTFKPHRLLIWLLSKHMCLLHMQKLF